MVRDLVVVDEVHVDAPRPAKHLSSDQRHVQVAQDPVAGRPEEGEGPRPVHTGYDVAAPLLASLEPLPHHLDRGPPDAAREPVGTDHEPGDGLTRLHRAAAELDPAHGHHVRRGVPGEQVGDRHAVVGEQALGRCWPAPRSTARLPAGWRRRRGPAPGRTTGTPGCRRASRAGCPAGWPGSCRGAAPSTPAADACRCPPTVAGSAWCRTAGPTAPPGTARRRAGRRRRRRSPGPGPLAFF